MIPVSMVSSNDFLKGDDVRRADVMSPMKTARIDKVEFVEGKAYKEKATDPDVREMKVRLTLFVFGLGVKCLDLNKTNLKTVTAKYGKQVGEQISLDTDAMIGKAIALDAKLENNGKYSVVIYFSDTLDAMEMPKSNAITPNPIYREAAQQSSEIDSKISQVLADLDFMINWPYNLNGKVINNLADKVATMKPDVKQRYLNCLNEIMSNEIDAIANKPIEDDFS